MGLPRIAPRAAFVYSVIDSRKEAMTITLPPDIEAKLIALAQARGLSADELVREVIGNILVESSEVASAKEPTKSLRGLLAPYGPAPSAEEIEQNRAEMFAEFPRSDFE
jgi:uncharacterized membrane protein